MPSDLRPSYKKGWAQVHNGLAEDWYAEKVIGQQVEVGGKVIQSKKRYELTVSIQTVHKKMFGRDVTIRVYASMDESYKERVAKLRPDYYITLLGTVEEVSVDGHEDDLRLFVKLHDAKIR